MPAVIDLIKKSKPCGLDFLVRVTGLEPAAS